MAITENPATKKAMIRIVDKAVLAGSKDLEEIMYVQFNPASYAVSKSVNYAETPSVLLDLPMLEFASGQAETLTIQLLFDTTSDGMGAGATDVTTQTRKIYALTQIQSETHAPPVVQFVWNTFEFQGVVTTLQETFTLFNPDGVPLRATLSVTFKKYMQDTMQIKQQSTNSPDRFRTYVVAAGDTLPAIATAAYDDPFIWPLIADANADVISNPRRLKPGQRLLLPKLDANGKMVSLS